MNQGLEEEKMHKLLLFTGLFSYSHAYTLPYIVAVQEEQTLWIALFGLGLIGIFALFLSSDQLKRVNQQHDNMIRVQSEIEQKQQMVLEFIGKNIEMSTKEIVLHKEILTQKSFEKMTPKFFNDEMERFDRSRASLLDATHELVDFLQIKSGHLEVTEESYRLSTILDDIYGSITDRLKESKTELVYDIDPNIGRELRGDPKHIEQVLRILLIDMFSGIKNSLLSLTVSFSENDKSKLCFEIHNKDKTLTQEEIIALFSSDSIKEEYKSKEKLDLYVAYELIINMGGSLNVHSSNEEGTYYTIELPYHVQDSSLLLSQKSRGKHVLIIEEEQKVGHAIAHMLVEHEINVDLYSAQDLASKIPNLYKYDMVLINTMLLSYSLLDKLEKVRKENGCKVVELENSYNKSSLLEIDKRLIDITLQKPLQNEQIFNVLEKIFDTQESHKSKNPKFTLLPETAGITIESFTKFSHAYVLIAEDNQMNQKILKGVLGNSGMKIIMVKNGQEALDEVRRNKELDLVFMDINMPTMDGYEATKEIREIYDEKQLPIVAISGSESQNDLDRIESVGANTYIHKPYQLGELYSAFAMYATEEKSKIKNINYKLSKYEGDKQVLDIQKGISHSHTAVFYRETLKDVLLKLKDSNILVEKYSTQHEVDKIKVFISDTLGLAEKIGAKSFVKVLTEIDQLFVYKEENRIQEYTHMYKKEWDKLKKEIEEYLKY